MERSDRALSERELENRQTNSLFEQADSVKKSMGSVLALLSHLLTKLIAYLNA